MGALNRAGAHMPGKHIIFLVPGMGTYVDDDNKPVDDWHKAAKKVIARELKKYPEYTGGKDIDHFYEFVPVNYDALFERLANKWGKIANQVADAGLTDAGALVDFFKGGKDPDNFFWTHFADVLLYYFSPLVRDATQATVASQIATKLNAEHQRAASQGGTVRPFSIIAHSLGTSVVSDVIQAKSKFLDENGYGNIWPPVAYLAMLANVSKLLERKVVNNVYAGHVVPGDYCNRYLSAAHKYDPFTWYRPFKPPLEGTAWGDKNPDPTKFGYVPVQGLKNFTLPDSFPDNPSEVDWSKLVREVTPHGFEHYFANPVVHLNIFKQTLHGAVIRSTTIVAKQNEFDQKSSDALRERLLKKIKLPDEIGDTDSILEILEKIKALFKTIGSTA
tara:strand:+ start:73 stop:1239 length:1167 start_codon:yes stop_codon:yes gene_type:complete